MALVVGLGGRSVAAAGTQRPRAPRNTVYVHTVLGGFILGYDIDQTGRDGLLAEAFTLPDGNADVAIESFDQVTGNARILLRQNDTKNDFVVLGIFGQDTGLSEFEHVSGIYVDKRLYVTMHPRRRWTPPINTGGGDLIIGLAPSQGASGTAVLYSEAGNNSYVFGADVSANTFGSLIELTDPVFAVYRQPVIAIDAPLDEAVVASSNGGPTDLSMLALVDLGTGAVTEFQGIGFGQVAGIAVDSADGIAVTSSYEDFSLEYYNLATQQGFKVPLENCDNFGCSGSAVAYDAVNHLFLVQQPFSSVGGSTGAIQVFDTNGNYVEAITNLHVPTSPAPLVLHPSKRTGFVIVDPLDELESFTY
jgi:hypothetical protein